MTADREHAELKQCGWCAQFGHTTDEHAAAKNARIPGHVFSVCGNCGEAWPTADPPDECVRCAKGPVHTTVRCPGCDKCVTQSGGSDA